MATRHQEEGGQRRGHADKGAIRPVCEPTPSACWERIHIGTGRKGRPGEPDKLQMAASLDPEDRARYLLQRKIEEQTELAAGLSQLQELRHQTATDIIDNIR
jgi:hypothetical protein